MTYPLRVFVVLTEVSADEHLPLFPALSALSGVSPLTRVYRAARDLYGSSVTVLAPAQTRPELAAHLPADALVHTWQQKDRGELRLNAVREAARLSGKDEAVLLVDAERALCDSAALRSVSELAPHLGRCAAIAPTVDVTDSVKEVTATGLRNVDRSRLGVVQGPRLFAPGVLQDLVRDARGEGWDEIHALASAGAEIATLPGAFAYFPVLDRLSLWQAEISLGHTAHAAR
ncbi:2-C-methyl-D-erythritol 4-phosphate cytidylyltransferase [Dermabacteraceae bacterium TAE3-ERU27]|nr:2-C-methyl-D-erythritol 4-phosphate cytidylyltransferase [Dermabacteraceae bacterium TAE3-ERU27]